MTDPATSTGTKAGISTMKHPFSLLDRWPITPVVTGAFAVFVLLIIILGAFQRGPELLEFPATLFLLYSLLLAVVFAGLFSLVEKAAFLHKPFVFPVLVTGIAFIPRYIWIRLVETTPLWDFARYLNYARSIVGGDPGAIAEIRGVFPHLTGYPLLLSWVMNLFGTDVSVARWFNLFCTLVSLLLLYQLGKTAFSPRTGRSAALLFALWPGQIYYVSVLGAEHLFTMLMLGVLLLFVMAGNGEPGVWKQAKGTAALQENAASQLTGIRSPALWTAFFLAFLTGAVLSFAHIVRPVASLLFPAFFLYLLLKPVKSREKAAPGYKAKDGSTDVQPDQNQFPDDSSFEKAYISKDEPGENRSTEVESAERKSTGHGSRKPVYRNKSVFRTVLAFRLPLFALILAGFFLTLTLLNAVYEPQVKVPLGKTGAGFNLYVGTNKESRGMWSAGDWAIIEEFNYDFDRIHEEAWNRGMERIREDYRDFLLLAERKFAIQWSVSDYGFYWGMLELDRVTAVSLWAEDHRQELQVASQVFYLSLMWLILLGLWCTRKSRFASFNAFIAILFFGFIAMHTLIEVQSRYHHSLVPLFMLSAAYGAAQLSWPWPRSARLTGQKRRVGVS